MLNMYWDAISFELPSIAGRSWRRAIDTSLAPPLDIADPGTEQPVAGGNYLVQGRKRGSVGQPEPVAGARNLLPRPGKTKPTPAGLGFADMQLR